MNEIILAVSITVIGSLNTRAMNLLKAALSPYDSIHSITAVVSARESYSSDTTVSMVKYRFYFVSPNKVRYDFFEPDTGTMLMDGRRVWLYRPGDTVAYFSPAPSDTGEIETPLSSFHIIDTLISLGFSVSESKLLSDSTVRIKLVPPEFADVSMEIELDISLKDTTLRSVVISGPGFANRTDYTGYRDAGGGILLPTKISTIKTRGNFVATREVIFEELHVNGRIPGKVFEFVPPAGVHIRPLLRQK